MKNLDTMAFPLDSLTLRLANRKDLDTLGQLYADMDGHDPLSSTTLTDIFEQIQTVPNYSIYLVEAQDLVIGTFSLLILPTMMHEGYHQSALLDSVTVLSSYRSKGIGRWMMQQAMQICRAEGCYKLMLSSNLQRYRAHNFYQSLGFQQHGWSFSLKL